MLINSVACSNISAGGTVYNISEYNVFRSLQFATQSLNSKSFSPSDIGE